MASSSKGVKICIAKPDATGTTLVAVSATKAAPAVIEVADVTGLVKGQLIKLASDSTGLESIDGKNWVIGTVDGTGNTFELVGSDTTNDTGTFAAGGNMKAYLAADMQCMCFSEFSFSPEQPSQISTATFCKPQDAIASAATAAGGVSFGGYIDITDASYKFLIDNVGKDVDVLITFPDNGAIVVPITIDTVNWDIPIDGALGFSGTGTMRESPRHLF